jgi:hypothetical protein
LGVQELPYDPKIVPHMPYLLSVGRSILKDVTKVGNLMKAKKIMEIIFEQLSSDHQQGVMNIYNFYVENSFAAYPENNLPDEFFYKILDMTKDFPSYAIKIGEKIIGFAFLRYYNPLPTFKGCAEISYFIDKNFPHISVLRAWQPGFVRLREALCAPL